MLACERGKKLNEVEDKTEQLSNDAKVILEISKSKCLRFYTLKKTM